MLSVWSLRVLLWCIGFHQTLQFPPISKTHTGSFTGHGQIFLMHVGNRRRAVDGDMRVNRLQGNWTDWIALRDAIDLMGRMASYVVKSIAMKHQSRGRDREFHFSQSPVGIWNSVSQKCWDQLYIFKQSWGGCCILKDLEPMWNMDLRFYQVGIKGRPRCGVVESGVTSLVNCHSSWNCNISHGVRGICLSLRGSVLLAVAPHCLTVLTPSPQNGKSLRIETCWQPILSLCRHLESFHILKSRNKLQHYLYYTP